MGVKQVWSVQLKPVKGKGGGSSGPLHEPHSDRDLSYSTGHGYTAADGGSTNGGSSYSGSMGGSGGGRSGGGTPRVTE